MIENNEKRKQKRYEAEQKIYFDFSYPMETKMRFQVSDNINKSHSKRKYLALSRNVSSEGLCFVSQKKLKKGSFLDLEVFLPGDQEKIHMEGEVKWCDCAQENPLNELENQQFDTGVKLVSVEGKPVQETIHFDEIYQVEWSTVLEAILGKFRILMQNKHKKEETE